MLVLAFIAGAITAILALLWTGYSMIRSALRG